MPGEAAAFAAVASAALVEARGLSPVARVLSAATSREEVTPRDAGAAPRAGPRRGDLAAALAALPEGAQVDEAVCDLNGERWRGDDAGFALARAARRFAHPGRMAAPALSFGDVGAASGALWIAVAVHAARRGHARGPLALLWTGAEGGARAAALIATPLARRE